MISGIDKENLQQLLGKNYSKPVYNKLIEKGITNSNDTPYSREHIRMVFNGFKENHTIEEIFYEMAAEKKRAIEKRKSLIK